MYKINLFALLLFTALLLSSCSEEKKETLVGQWEPVIRPYNLGSVLIFEDDSSFTQIKEARVNYTYKLVGDTLISTSFDGFTGKEIIDTAHVAISGDTLILVRGKVGDQQETVMKRYDSIYTNTKGIVGLWVWPHQSGKDAISEYHPGGKASVSVLIEKGQGNYFVNRDYLTVIMPGTTLRDIYFKLKGDSLFFPDKFAPFGNAFYRVTNEKD
ncbi:MAG: hypothetical protein A2V93_11655 [Ignavibacteria bacterium RBG_16_34_14]|nr:MAG: hypothetical protein A2V93_11655 [Ignavibacteria bacterium RBG_16_34_14]